MLTTLLLIIATACGQTPVHMQGQVVDADFKPYLNSFLTEARNHNVAVDASKVQIKYGNTGAQLWAACNLEVNNTPVITVAADLHDQDIVFQKIVIYHELGHCLLGRGHLDTVTGGIPDSIMKHDLVPINVYLSNETSYLNELFK